jgi:thiamine-phosphate pyrophosphorylase
MRNKIKQRLEEYLRLYLIFEIDYLKIPLTDFLESVFDAGLKSIQLRCKKKSAKERYDIGLIIKRYIRKRDVLFIVNDRLDLAVLLHADGCHLGQTDLPIISAKKHFNNMILGYSCHSVNDINFAKKHNIDYVGLGSVFPTNTKEDVEKIIGLNGLQELSNCTSDIPSVAIGGINKSNLHKLIHFPLAGFAISSAICSSYDPGRVVSELFEIINGQ